MKLKYSLLTLLLFVFTLYSNAEDITLDAEGYNGTVQWEQSEDGWGWTKIENAKNKTFTVPESSKLYYRAAITSNDKGGYYSEVFPAFNTLATLDSAVWECHIPLMGSGLYGLDWFNKLRTCEDRVWHENPEGLDKLIIMTDEFSETWRDCYRGVYRTSYAIKHIANTRQQLTSEQQASREAQIRAVRAYYYFLLVTLFNNPPYYDETSLPPMHTDLPNGSPVAFWNKIEADLDFCIPLLPESYEGLDNPLSIKYDKKALLTKGAAQALLGKALLWKHYYYYLENDITEGRIDNLTKAKELFSTVINSGNYALQGEDNKPVSKQDFLNCLISNSTHVAQIEGLGGKAYKGRNNKESLWEIQFGSNDNNNGAWLPGYYWDGARNYQYFGVSNSSYLNHEVDPEAFYVYDTPAAGTAAKTAGFDRDPRAYATFFLDKTTLNPDGSWMDWREESSYYRLFSSATGSKRRVTNNQLYNGTMPLGTGAMMLKKYSYPSFTTLDGGFRPPNCDPFNIRVIRFADVLLMYAEACLLSGSNTTEGLAALNRVRARAGMQPENVLNAETIIKERDMELMGEGFRYLDIVRWERSADWFNAINFSDKTPISYRFSEHFRLAEKSGGTNRLRYMPIPQREVDRSKKLRQNSSWAGYDPNQITTNFTSFSLTYTYNDPGVLIFKDSVIVESYNLGSKVFTPAFATSNPDDKVYIGSTLQVSNESEVDFTSPVTYTIVTAAGKRQDIKVKVQWLPLSSENELFSLSALQGSNTLGFASINEASKSIALSFEGGGTRYRLNISASHMATVEVKFNDIYYVYSSTVQYDLRNVSAIRVTSQDGAKVDEYSFTFTSE